MRGGVLRNTLGKLCFFQQRRNSVVPAEGFRRVRLQFFLTLKQETAGTEPGDDEQAAGKFQQQAGKHPKRRSGTGPEGVHDILSGKDKFRQQRPQERHEQKAYDGGEKEAPRHGAR